jgi:RecG-like helicase
MMPKPEQSVQVTLLFPTDSLKRKVMRELCEWIETLDARIEWPTEDIDRSYAFNVKYGVIPDEDDDDDFGMGLLDTELENEFDTELEK